MIKIHIWYPIRTPLAEPIGFLTPHGVYPLPIPNRAEPFHRWGHAGIRFMNVSSASGEIYPDMYRAFWPSDGVDWQAPNRGRIIDDLNFDVTEERSSPSRQILLRGDIDEAACYNYWTNLAADVPDYSAFGFNCCGAVAASVQAGLPSVARGSSPPYPPLSFAGGWLPIGYSSNPYSLEDWAEAINMWLRVRSLPVTDPRPVVSHGHHDRS